MINCGRVVPQSSTTTTVAGSGSTTTTSTTTSTTTTTVDTTGPVILSVFPTAESVGANLNTTITAVFNEPIDSNSLMFSLEANGVFVAGTLVYNSNSNGMTFTPANNLPQITPFEARILGSVEDMFSNQMGGDNVWNFVTGSSLDSTVPTIESVSPADGATGVAVNATISAIFSEAMNPIGVNDGTFLITNDVEDPVQGAVSYVAATKKAIFTPNEALNQSSTYNALLRREIVDLGGNILAAEYSWQFETGTTTSTTGTTQPGQTTTTSTTGTTQPGQTTTTTTTTTSSTSTSTTTTTSTSTTTVITWNEEIITSNYSGASVYALDFDGDIAGDMDILSTAVGITDEVTWWRMTSGMVTMKIMITSAAYVPSEPRSIFAADIDGDSDNDIITASQHSNEIAWWENNGTAYFAKNVVDSGFSNASCVMAADIDGDSDNDLLGSSWASDGVVWWKNDGSGNFTKFVVDANFDVVRSVYAIDLDQDGNMDVLGASYADYEIAWWKNDGNENFTKYTIGSNIIFATSVFAVDLDGDNDLDVLGTSGYSNQVIWWENDGSENFTKHTIDSSFAGAWDVYAIDIDGDSDIDVLGAAGTGDEISWWENDGSENFSKRVIASNLDQPAAVFAIDLDSDGDIDVLGAVEGGSQLIWWEQQ